MISSITRLAITLTILSAPAVSVAAETFIVVSHGQANDPFWNVVKNGVEAAGKDMGVVVEYRSPETFDMIAMSHLIEAAVQQEPDGLVVSLPDGEALRDAVQRAVAAGIPVVSMNSGSDVSAELGVLFHVGQEEYDAGVGAGKRMRELGVTRLACVNHEMGNVSLDLRYQGVIEGYEGEVLLIPTQNNTAGDVYAKVRAALIADSTIDGLITLGASNAGEPALKAVIEAGLVGQLQLGTFDLSPTILEAVRDGAVSFTIDQQQFLQGYLPIVHLALYLRYSVLPGGNIPTGPGFVTSENAANVIELSAQGIR